MSDNINVPVIMTQWGPVTERARKQAVLNMRRDSGRLKMMIEKFGEERIRRDYPEVFIVEEEES